MTANDERTTMAWTADNITALEEAILNTATTGQSYTLPTGQTVTMANIDTMRSLLREMKAEAGIGPRLLVQAHLRTD